MRRQKPRRDTGRSHADKHQSFRPTGASQPQQPDHVAGGPAADSQLDDLGPGPAHRPIPFLKIARGAIEIVHRQHDVPPVPFRDQRLETTAPLEIDPVGAQRERTTQNAVTFFLGSREPSALPHGTAGDEHRAGPVRQRSLDVEITHRVEPELDQVRVMCLVPARAELGRRRCRHGGAQLSTRHLVSRVRRSRTCSGRGIPRGRRWASRSAGSNTAGMLPRPALQWPAAGMITTPEDLLANF